MDLRTLDRARRYTARRIANAGLNLNPDGESSDGRQTLALTDATAENGCVRVVPGGDPIPEC